MTYEYKIKFEQEAREEQAVIAIENWQNCPLSQLEAAAKIFDIAISLLIKRYAQNLIN